MATAMAGYLPADFQPDSGQKHTAQLWVKACNRCGHINQLLGKLGVQCRITANE